MPKINWKFLVDFPQEIFVIVNFLPKTQSAGQRCRLSHASSSANRK